MTKLEKIGSKLASLAKKKDEKFIIGQNWLKRNERDRWMKKNKRDTKSTQLHLLHLPLLADSLAI